MLEKEEAYMALDLVTPFTKVQLEEEIKDTGRKQVGILGGNFNPVHNAHLVVADQVRQQIIDDCRFPRTRRSGDYN